MKGNVRLRLALIVASCFIALTGVGAGQRVHTVSAGESASSIAKRYYGDVELGVLLLSFNGRRDTTIQPGEQLRIPYCDVHTVKAGDAWSALAQRYLNRPSAYPVVGALNGRTLDKPLQVGETIVFPVVLRHQLQGGETLAVLAERFYDDSGRSRLLQEFNRIDDPRKLAVGATVEVPLLSFRLEQKDAGRRAAAKPAVRTVASRPKVEKTQRQVSPPPAPSRSEPEPPKTVSSPPPVKAETKKDPEPRAERPARFQRQLRAATKAFLDGDYDRAREVLEPLRGWIVAEGSEKEQAEFWKLLSFVHVAYDDSEQACAARQSLTAAEREAPFDAELVSPKIRETLSQCE